MIRLLQVVGLILAGVLAIGAIKWVVKRAVDPCVKYERRMGSDGRRELVRRNLCDVKGELRK